MMATVKSILDIRAHSQNPRSITSQQLKQLDNSIKTLGDLSGIVVNVHGKLPVTVSGHQRLKTLKNKKTKIVKQEQQKDKYGTVATGWIEVQSAGGIIKIPYREVEWPKKSMELLGLVNANSGGGEFDQAKLGAVLAELENRKFNVESIAMDSFDLQKAIIHFERTQRTDAPSTNSSAKEAASEEFAAVDPRADEGAFNHECPRCKFKQKLSKKELLRMLKEFE